MSCKKKADELYQERMEELVKCSICFEPLSQPKLLPTCGHSFCLRCLKKVPVVNGVLNCPLCRSLTPSRGDLSTLPDDRTARAVVEQLHSPAPSEWIRTPPCAIHRREPVAFQTDTFRLLCSSCDFFRHCEIIPIEDALQYIEIKMKTTIKDITHIKIAVEEQVNQINTVSELLEETENPGAISAKYEARTRAIRADSESQFKKNSHSSAISPEGESGRRKETDPAGDRAESVGVSLAQ